MAIITAEQQLCDLYNAANPSLPHPLTPDDVTFGSRGPYTPEDTEGMEIIPNYALNMTAREDSPHFFEGITVHYRRVPTGFTGGTELVDGTLTDWNDDDFVLGYFNTLLQRQYMRDAFLLEEVEITRVDNETEKTRDVTLSFRNHIKFTDDTITWMVHVPEEKFDLSGANGELNGF